MKKAILISFISMIWITICFPQQNYETGVILLKIKDPDIVSIINGQPLNGSQQLIQLFQEFKAQTSRKLRHVNRQTDGWYRIEFPATTKLNVLRDELRTCPDVADATLNYYGVFDDTPNDALWSNQWAIQKIQMENAWDVIKPNSTILVGVMDTGLDYNHEDLLDNIWNNPDEIAGNGVDDDNNGFVDDIRGWDFVNDDNDPQESSSSHGTRAAGVIAARTFNSSTGTSIGLAGIAGGWQNQVGVQLIGVRMGTSTFWRQDHAAEALNYLTALRQAGNVVVANMSFNNYINTDAELSLFKDAVEDAKNAGVIMFASAGNIQATGPYSQPDVTELPAPARWFGVLAIGASVDGSTLQDEVRASYSLYDDDAALLVVAPVDQISGSSVETTFPDDQYVSNFSGTSAACPIAVGITSLMHSIDPTLAWNNIRTIFQNTSEKIGPYTYTNGRTEEVGYGRINAYEAVKEAVPTKISADITSNTTWNSHVLVRKPAGGFDLYVDGVTLTIASGAVVVIEGQVRLTAINGGVIKCEPGAKIILEPAAESLLVGDLSPACLTRQVIPHADNRSVPFHLSEGDYLMG